MYCIVFDTETTSLNKPFCYDVGYVVLNMDNGEIEKEVHKIVEQNWHNLPLFESAYYKEKRPLYVKLMRAKKASMDKWGYIMRDLARDIKQYNITDAYAYNSDFDDKVFEFNCDWFKCINPLETVAIHDIWGYASQFITNKLAYKAYCEEHERFTDTGNYKGSAEVVYQYIMDDKDFIEDHMGLYDSKIESEILVYCISEGAEWAHDYKVNKILKREQEQPFAIRINNETIYEGNYIRKVVRQNDYNFITREAR